MIYDPEKRVKKKIRQQILKASPVPTSAAAGDALIRTASVSAIIAAATATAAAV